MMRSDLLIPDAVSSLEPFVEAGLLGELEINATATFSELWHVSDFESLLAAALTVRAALLGHTCVDLSRVAETVSAEDSKNIDALPWPDPDLWLNRVAASGLVEVVTSTGVSAQRSEPTPLVVDEGLVYLRRYWFCERFVAASLINRSAPKARSAGLSDAGAAAMESIKELFTDPIQVSGTGPATQAGPATRTSPNARKVDSDQLDAALATLSDDLVVVSGGPGTGKTTTVARLLGGVFGADADHGARINVKLVAPTGKAAARMTESIRFAVAALEDRIHPEASASLSALEATTIHRFLGNRKRSRVQSANGGSGDLPVDLLIADEMSMVSLSLMAQLMASLDDSTKVVLVGDPFQLASVEAGVVLGDIVAAADGATPISRSIHRLRTVHRQAEESPILSLAESIRIGDADAVIDFMQTGGGGIEWLDTPRQSHHQPSLATIEKSVIDNADRAVGAAMNGDPQAAMDLIQGLKVLCATTRSAYGVSGWNTMVETALRERGVIHFGDSYEGQPVMVTVNDSQNMVFNGDVGVTIRSGPPSPGSRGFKVWFPRADSPQIVERVRLANLATQWAMTIHKSQGSEFNHVVMSLPPAPSPILTRELLYTAVTRAKERITVIGSEESIRTAVGRPVARSSGLTRRLS